MVKYTGRSNDSLNLNARTVLSVIVQAVKESAFQSSRNLKDIPNIIFGHRTKLHSTNLEMAVGDDKTFCNLSRKIRYFLNVVHVVRLSLVLFFTLNLVEIAHEIVLDFFTTIFVVMSHTKCPIYYL